MSNRNVTERLDRIVDAFDGQLEYIERCGSDRYYGPLFEDVPKADYWVFTGRGRSKHIADKTSASLASTGTSSYFTDTVDDPAHLNRLTARDRVMLVHRCGHPSDSIEQLIGSLGGDVPLDVITNHAKGWPSRPGHRLIVDVPDAPLTDTVPDILALAIGDSLVAGLESARQFTEIDFLKDHPKGALGKNIAAAKESGKSATVTYLPPPEQALDALRQERDGVAALRDGLDAGALSAWLDLLSRPWKRVITTGMGKPGYCMRYLTVLLNERGRPSFYLHPAEGVHGDLGRIGPDSLVIAYSHSGETEEVLSILPRMKERGATLISLTNSPASTLGTESHAVLKAGAPEVDPIRKAPTGSTTAALSLATALVG